MTGRRLGGALVGAAVARTALEAWRRRPPGGVASWDRTNHRGEPVSLLSGPAFLAGAAGGALLAPGATPRARLATAVAVLGAGAVGHYDDHRAGAGGQAKGLAGHAAALASGRFTTGAAKVVGLVATGAVAGALLPPGRQSRANVAVAAAVVAGYANLANLLDLRPGRCLKFGLLHAPVLLAPGGAVLAGPLGAAAGLLDTDLRERTMLGDTGSNALGAALGTAVLACHGRLGRAAHLAALCALTLAGERISFTAYIASHEPLRRLDELGRRPKLPPSGAG